MRLCFLFFWLLHTLSSCSLVLEISIQRENVTQKVRLQGPSYAGVYIQGRRNRVQGRGCICTPNIWQKYIKHFPSKHILFLFVLTPQFFSPFAGTDINQASMSCRPVPKFSLLLGTVFSYVSHTELSKKKCIANKIHIFILGSLCVDHLIFEVF